MQPDSTSSYLCTFEQATMPLSTKPGWVNWMKCLAQEIIPQDLAIHKNACNEPPKTGYESQVCFSEACIRKTAPSNGKGIDVKFDMQF
jgi:hypothetical protein